MCEICVKGEAIQRELVERSATGLATEGDLKAMRENCSLYNTHKRIAQHQRNAFKQEKTNLKPGQALVVMDFKENLTVGSGPVEVGQDFYSKSQVSCLGAAIYHTTSEGETKTHYMDFLSYDLTHDGLFVATSLDRLIHNIKKIIACDLEEVSFWFDCGTHFRCYEVLHDMLVARPSLHGLREVRVNYFAEHHGKSAVDSHFSHVSAACREFVRKERMVDIHDLYRAIEVYFESAKHSQVTVWIISLPSRNHIKKLNLKRSDNTPVLIQSNYCYVFSKGVVSVASLTGRELRPCSLSVSTVDDTRATKRAPLLEQRTSKRSFNCLEPIVGSDTRKRLRMHAQSLCSVGTPESAHPPAAASAALPPTTPTTPTPARAVAPNTPESTSSTTSTSFGAPLEQAPPPEAPITPLRLVSAHGIVTEAYVCELESMAGQAANAILAPQTQQGTSVLEMLRYSQEVVRWNEKRKAAAAPFWEAALEARKVLHNQEMKRMVGLGDVLEAMVSNLPLR